MDKSFQEIISKEGGSLLERQETRAILDLIYDAWEHVRGKKGLKLLNVFASRDHSGFRESVYKNLFANADYETIDFWQDQFIHDGKELGTTYNLPFKDNTFDVVLTTKIILEHISEPLETLRELYRVTKKGGEVFIVVPFFRNVHQEPYDFFRYTEFGFRHIAEKAGFKVVYIKPTSSGLVTATNLRRKYGLFRIYSPLHKITDIFYKNIYMPFIFWLDKYVPDGGKVPQQYIARLIKN
jgi:SAM-dependent methyltransferase